MEGENNERALEPVGEIRPRRFEPPIERTGQKRMKYQKRVRRGHLNQESDEC